MTTEYLFESIVTCIEDKTTSFMKGVAQAKANHKVALCSGHTPQNAPARHSVVLDRSGGAVDGMLVDKIDLPIQIISRATTYTQARDDAMEFYRALHGSCCKPLPFFVSGQDYQANIIDAMQSPFYLGFDSKLFHQFTCNYMWLIAIAQT